MSDYIALIMALGFVMLFSSVAPFISVLCLAIFVVKLKADAWKMTHVFRRPFPYAATGIGAWNDIVELLAWLGLMTSVAIPIMNREFFRQYSPEAKLVFFFVVEHILALLKGVLSTSGGTSRLKLMVARRAHVVRALFGGKDDQSRLEPKWKPPEPDLSKISPLNQSSPEWRTVDSEDISPQYTGDKSDEVL